MFKTYDLENGIPPRIYRSPAEVRRDIREIKNKIEDINLMLNIRSVLTDIMADERAGSPERLAPVLREAIADVEEAVSELSALEEELAALREELGDVKYLFGN